MGPVLQPRISAAIASFNSEATSPRAAAEREASEQIVFGFYDDQLFRLTVDYDRERTEGLTDADMIEAISAIYGSQVKPRVSTNKATFRP